MRGFVQKMGNRTSDPLAKYTLRQRAFIFWLLPWVIIGGAAADAANRPKAWDRTINNIERTREANSREDGGSRSSGSSRSGGRSSRSGFGLGDVVQKHRNRLCDAGQMEKRYCK